MVASVESAKVYRGIGEKQGLSVPALIDVAGNPLLTNYITHLTMQY